MQQEDSERWIKEIEELRRVNHKLSMQMNLLAKDFTALKRSNRSLATNNRRYLGIIGANNETIADLEAEVRRLKDAVVVLGNEILRYRGPLRERTDPENIPPPQWNMDSPMKIETGGTFVEGMIPPPLQ
jgi:hypothetical protein